MSSQSVHIQWTFAELGEYISNTSAYVAKTLAQGAEGMVFDAFTITEDEHRTFLNDKLEEALLAVTPFFNRITPDESTPILPTTSEANVGISFVPRIEGGEYSLTDFAFVESLTKRYIASYILFEWYSIKGVTAMMQYFDGQRENAGKNLRDRLFRFVRPSRKSGITIRRVYGTRSDKTTTTKVNNRSDFVLVWGPSDGSPLPDFNYDIVFYTEDSGLQYTVQTDSEYYKPIVGVDGVVRQAKIIFDLKGEYFPNGVLKYEMSGNVPDADFPEGVRYFEQVGETNVEIWDGATDANKSLEAAYLPAFVNVRFEDLTDEEIATIQAPALEAAAAANSAAASAVTATMNAQDKAQYAKEQGDAAKEAIETITNLESEISSQESIRKSNERGRIQNENERISAERSRNTTFNDLKTSVQIIVTEAQESVREAVEEAEGATAKVKEAEEEFTRFAEAAETEEQTRATNEEVRKNNEINRLNAEANRNTEESKRASAEKSRVSAEQGRVSAESSRVSVENNRVTAESSRVQAESKRVSAESARVQAESDRQQRVDTAISNAQNATDSANAAATNAEKAAEEASAAREDVDKAIANLEGGNYPQMSVGFAQEIVGDGSATEEEFSFRPTAGEDRNVANTTYYEGERNGVARIEKLKGNSVVWNNPIKNKVDTTGSGTDGWYKRGGSSVSVTFDGDLITQVTTTSTTNVQLSQNVGFTQYHKYFLLWEWDYPEEVFTLETANIIRLQALGDRNGATASEIFNVHKESKGKYETIWEQTSSGLPFIALFLRRSSNFIAAQSWTIRNRIKICDLTQMFGAGNEPTTVEEFYERMPKGVDINAFNEGEIVDGHYGAIKTVGFNAFNGTYAKVCGGCPYYLGGDYTSLGFATEEGGTTEAIAIPTSTESVGTTPSDRLYTPSQNGYIYAEGNNININLSWDTEYGYLNGTLQPYKPFERDISWVAQYFPNGMRSAGSARDEIRFNSTTQKWEAVQNVGSRAYTSGDESNSAVTTDGTTTNYALTTPVVTEIEEMPNMDFDVSDYGTEELIAQEGKASAPIVADIAYAPNALSTLKQVPDILARLKALETAVASATSTTNMEE